MTKRIIWALATLISVLMVSDSLEAGIIVPKKVDVEKHTAGKETKLPAKKDATKSDSPLPANDNPEEIDIGTSNGELHISFKGAFRAVDDKGPRDVIYFFFVATPKNDMGIRVSASELFDNNGTRFKTGERYRNWIVVGRENLQTVAYANGGIPIQGREIIGGIPMLVQILYEIPVADAEMIARVSFYFNGTWFQYRNIKVQEWSEWEAIKQELGLK